MRINRRDFLKHSGVAAGLGAAGVHAAAAGPIMIDPSDPVASSAPVQWALRELQAELAASRSSIQIAAGGPASTVSSEILSRLPNSPETLALIPGKTLLAYGSDTRGLVYALTELTDRLRAGAPLEIPKPIIETPANTIRSVTRCFVSDVEDKPWYNDKSMWAPYLSMLVAQRFNRFSLAFGIGYDFTRQIRDCYFHFPYPFLFDMPGYKVRAVGLPDDERDNNFEMLKFIAKETVAHGLQFQLGVWTHAYQWTDSPHANYTIEGLTPANHGAYCRDSLNRILEACPEISGVTFRIHGESGVPEGSYDFWKTVFDGVVRTGRKIEIDMHAKGMDDGMIKTALSTGLPVNISPKFWAEHMGLPYHQAGIRELEMPPREAKDNGFFSLSSGSRRFLRYGYGDLLAEDRKYGVLFRIWPGTQRTLLWGDPAFASGYGRAFSFCGSKGVEICEPLSFKGRKGGGLPGGRNAYADESLKPKYDWQKFLYTYRLWGHMLYNPDTPQDVWKRSLSKDFGPAALAAGTALSQASRILPLVTTAHLPSAANNNYWPENYINMSIVDAGKKHPYSDTLPPKKFGAVSPLDTELFSRIDDYADQLLKGQRSGKYSPVEVAHWLDGLSATAAKSLAEAGKVQGVEFRRLSIDVAIQSGLGRFYASKLRSGVLYALYERTGDRAALEEAVKQYRAARDAWAELANRAKGVYRSDITYGFEYQLRGHWLDRLPAIDEDVADMARRMEEAKANDTATKAVREVLAKPSRPVWHCQHTPPARLRRGEPLEIALTVEKPNRPPSVQLRYRRVNQSERFQSVEMQAGALYRAAIPAAYTQSPFPVQYYFELDSAAVYPGFNETLSNQPYFVIV